jgi:hypothetical protein
VKTNHDLIDLTVILITETDKAILVDDGDNRVWLPKSKVEIEPRSDGSHTVTLPEWLAIDKGLV